MQRLDGILAVAVAAVAAAVAAWCAWRLGDLLYTDGSLNLWFQADTTRVVSNLLDPASNQYRAVVHPLFPLLLTPWVSLLPSLGMSPLWWGKAVVVATGAASAAAVLLALRFAGVARWASVIFAGLFVASAGFIHWYSMIEVAPFSGLSIAVMVLALAYGPSKRWIWWVLASGLTLSITITNWSAGLAATGARWPVRRILQITLCALVAVLALSVVQRLTYPTAGLFFNPKGLKSEQDYAAPMTRDWSPLANLRALIVYTAVVPVPVIELQDGSQVVTNQHQSLSSAGWSAIVAAGAWVALLVVGGWGALRPGIRPLSLGLGLMLLAQIALGLVYGNVTFLYASNILPMLILWAALSWFTPLRHVALALAVLVIALGAPNNISQFTAATRLAEKVVASGGNPKWSLYPVGRIILAAPPTRPAP